MTTALSDQSFYPTIPAAGGICYFYNITDNICQKYFLQRTF